MSKRYVSRTGKDQYGDITKLCQPGAYWSPRTKQSVITDIESGLYQYCVKWTDMETTIRVVNGPTGKYLRTDRDSTTRNNLDDLPDC